MIQIKKKQLNESEDQERYELISRKDVEDFDGFNTEYSLYFDHDKNNYFTVFGDSDIYGPEDDHDADFGSNEKAALEWMKTYKVIEDEEETVEFDDDDIEPYEGGIIKNEWKFESLEQDSNSDFEVTIAEVDDELEPIEGTEVKIPVTVDEVIKRFSDKSNQWATRGWTKENANEYFQNHSNSELAHMVSSVAYDKYESQPGNKHKLHHFTKIELVNQDAFPSQEELDEKNFEELRKKLGKMLLPPMARKESVEDELNEDVRKEWKPDTSFKHIKKVIDDAIARGKYVNNEREEVLAAMDKADKGGYTPEQRKFIRDKHTEMWRRNRNADVKESCNESSNEKDIKIVMKAAADVSSAADLDKVISSLNNIDHKLFLHYSEIARNGKQSPAAIGKDISDDLYYRLNESVNESEELDRHYFASLVKLGTKPWDGYSILNDGYFVKRIHAEDDDDAIKQFRDWVDNGGTRQEESCNEGASKLDIIKANKRNYQKAMDKIAELEDGLEKDVYQELILKWISGHNWLGGLSDAIANRAYEKLVRAGYAYDDIENKFWEIVNRDFSDDDNNELKEAKYIEPQYKDGDTVFIGDATESNGAVLLRGRILNNIPGELCKNIKVITKRGDLPQVFLCEVLIDRDLNEFTKWFEKLMNENGIEFFRGTGVNEKLIQSDSQEAFEKNLATEIKAGKPQKQALAIAYSVKRKNESTDFDPHGLQDYIKDWYIDEYDQDDLPDMYDEMRFSDLVELINKGDTAVFHYLPLNDTIRDRIFEEIAKRYGITYSEVLDAFAWPEDSQIVLKENTDKNISECSVKEAVGIGAHKYIVEFDDNGKNGWTVVNADDPQHAERVAANYGVFSVTRIVPFDDEVAESLSPYSSDGWSVEVADRLEDILNEFVHLRYEILDYSRGAVTDAKNVDQLIQYCDKLKDEFDAVLAGMERDSEELNENAD